MPRINLGPSTPVDIALGSSSIYRAYQGSQVVWPACDTPPFGCNTNVDPWCVTNFSYAWSNCYSIVTFPLIDVSQGTTFRAAWAICTGLTSFPNLDVSSGTDFDFAWQSCNQISTFPSLDVSSGTTFEGTWYNCTGFTSFPSLNFTSGANFQDAWYLCTNLTTFPAGLFDNCSATNFYRTWNNCALDQTSVDGILVSIDTAGTSGGILSLNGGSSSYPSSTGLAAKASLEARGWTVLVNSPPFAISFSLQPSNSSVTAPASTSFTAAASTNDGGTLSYQWQVSTDGGISFTNVLEAGVYSGVTTTTLSISNSTGLNSTVYRVVVTSTGLAPSATSSSATLTVSANPWDDNFNSWSFQNFGWPDAIALDWWGV